MNLPSTKSLALIALGGTALGFTSYMASKRKAKAVPTALSIGFVSALLLYFTEQSGYWSGVSDEAAGKVDYGTSVGRLGIYIPEPKVQKFSQFTGTQYFS